MLDKVMFPISAITPIIQAHLADDLATEAPSVESPIDRLSLDTFIQSQASEVANILAEEAKRAIVQAKYLVKTWKPGKAYISQ